MYKVFIDTNLFLRLYDAEKKHLTEIFKDIIKLNSSIVFVDQVYDEFLRNRDQLLSKLIKDVANNNQNLHVNSLIRSLEGFSELKEAKNIFDEKHNDLIKRLTEMKDNIEEDIVYSKFDELYNSKFEIYERTDDIIDKAYKRMLIGNPPIDDKKNTIGDQIIWETLLSNLKDDLIFITFDKTYEKHISFLKNEYKNRVHKELKIIDKVSIALSIIGETPSQELIEFEKTQKYKDFIEEDEVKDLLNHLKIVEIEISNEKLYNIFKASNDDYYKFMELIGVTPEIEEIYRKQSRSIHSDYITLYRKYFNPHYSPYKEDDMD